MPATGWDRFNRFYDRVEGQKLFKENGLVPATMPVRLVQPEDQ